MDVHEFSVVCLGGRVEYNVQDCIHTLFYRQVGKFAPKIRLHPLEIGVSINESFMLVTDLPLGR